MRWRAAVAMLLVITFTAGCATMSLIDTIESLLRQALELLNAKKYDEALVKLTEVIRRDPTQWKAYLYGAQAYLGKADFRQALTMLTDGIGHATDPQARAQLTQTLLDGGRQALARADYRAAVGMLAQYVRQDPTSVSGYLDLGRAYWAAGDRSDALGAFRRVLELAPGNEEARRFLLGR